MFVPKSTLRADIAILEKEVESLKTKLRLALQDRDDLLRGEIEKVGQRYRNMRMARLCLNDMTMGNYRRSHDLSIGALNYLLGQHP